MPMACSTWSAALTALFLLSTTLPSPAFWIGLLLAVAGSLVLVWGDLLRHVKFGMGDAMALAAAGCFAVYLMATEEVRTTTGTLAFLRLAIFSSTISLLIMNLLMGNSLHVPSARSWAALFGLALISQLGGYLALTYAMGHLPATITSVSLLMQVPLTAVLAALLEARQQVASSRTSPAHSVPQLAPQREILVSCDNFS